MLSDHTYRVGLIVLFISLVVFCIPEFVRLDQDDKIFYFLLNYVLTVFYFLHLFFDKRIFRRRGRGVRGIFLVLLLISAYALNRTMDVFASSVPWLSILLVICSINYLLIPYKALMPKGILYVHGMVLGVSLCLFIYLAIYLVPIYAFSAILSIGLGISLHAFVAILFVIYTIKVMLRLKPKGIVPGVVITCLIIIAYVITWAITLSKIEELAVRDNKDLPSWILVAQRAPHHFVAQQLLKSELVYNVPSAFGSGSFFREPGHSFDETGKHDPLVMTAALFCGKSMMAAEDRINILEAMYDSRHQAQERLWSGDDLSTAHIKTAARIWPQLHIAYTEKTITVQNNMSKGNWPRQEEAIYTFHLPEGAVVTSLSLWIKGKEEKGILTTKAKADSAYKQIVGVESRDPSVVHWQEGNTVAVRVFPVLSGESRQFKIGITSPLQKVSNQLVYKNIYFDGPSISHAREDVIIDFESTPYDLVMPWAFEMDGKTLQKHGGYKSDWEISFKDNGIRSNSFSANGKTFSIGTYRKELASKEIKDVYLDVSNGWTEDEFNNILTIFKNENKFVYVDGKFQYASQELFSSLQQQHFSVFPFHEVRYPSAALVITKGQPASPGFTDLGDVFTGKAKAFLAQHEKICLFNLRGELSPYLRTLKECRSFRYDQGDVNDLKAIAGKHLFPLSTENENAVIIESADLAITATNGTGLSSAPDHLQRLFAYNHIMQQSGPAFLTALPESDSLVQVAKEAYVVTPFSSLVVLETQEDYDRFNIKDSENSLKNASLHSSGSVPEPHEWALIILGVLTLLYIRSRKVAI